MNFVHLNCELTSPPCVGWMAFLQKGQGNHSAPVSTTLPTMYLDRHCRQKVWRQGSCFGSLYSSKQMLHIRKSSFSSSTRSMTSSDEGAPGLDSEVPRGTRVQNEIRPARQFRLLAEQNQDTRELISALGLILCQIFACRAVRVPGWLAR